MSSMKRWQATEKAVCKFLGKKHIGGPGEPDCAGGGIVVEVKDQERRVNLYQIERLVRRPWARGKPLIVASTSGFTTGARELASEFDDLWLYKTYRNGRSRRIVT